MTRTVFKFNAAVAVVFIDAADTVAAIVVVIAIVDDVTVVNINALVFFPSQTLQSQ